MMAFGCGAFGKWLGHEDGDLMNESDTIIKEILERSLFPSTMWGYRENTAIWEQERGPSPQIESASTLILDFPDSRTVRNIFLNMSPSLWYSITSLNELRQLWNFMYQHIKNS